MKSFSYLRHGSGVGADGSSAQWRDLVLVRHRAADPAARPHRVAYCAVRRGRRAPEHDAVVVSWFADGVDDGAWVADVEAGWGSGLVEVAASTTVRVDERFVRGGDELAAWRAACDGTSRLVLLVRIEAAAGTSRAEYRDYWWNVHRPFADTQIVDGDTDWYVHNYVRPDDPSNWAGIAEMYDRSVEAARARAAWMETDAALALRQDEERFLVRETRAATVTDMSMIIDEGPR